MVAPKQPRNGPYCFLAPWAHQAADIAAQEGTPAQPLNTFSALVYGLRHTQTVKDITEYLQDHPQAAVVNIGCGLDRLTVDLADYDCTIYNLDFPDVIEMRNRWLPKDDKEVDLPYSVTDHEWLTKVDGSHGVIAVAPGVFYYLKVADVAAVVKTFGEAFPGGRLVYDTESPMIMAQSEKQIARNGTPTAMPFKVKDPYEPQDWSDRIRDYHVVFNFLDYVESGPRRLVPRKHRMIFAAFERAKAMYVVHIGF